MSISYTEKPLPNGNMYIIENALCRTLIEHRKGSNDSAWLFPEAYVQVKVATVLDHEFYLLLQVINQARVVMKLIHHQMRQENPELPLEDPLGYLEEGQ